MEDKKTLIVNLEEPLSKGGGYTGYNCIFRASWQNNQEALKNILKVAPPEIQNLRLVRSTKETTEYYDKKETSVENNTRQVFKHNFEGIFEVPWSVNVKVVGTDLLVDYEVLLARPDTSLSYLLTHKKKADLRPQLEYHSSNYLHKKSRTPIDGLPVYLRTDEWHENTKEPKRITLFRSGINAHSLDVKDGNSISLAHNDKFHGNWNESWYVDVEKGKAKICSLDVRLNGFWSKK